MARFLDISLDSETWGTRAGFDIRSIGACVFDPLNRIIPHSKDNSGSTFYINCDNPLKFNGIYDVPFPPDYPQQEIDKVDGIHRKYNLLRDPKTIDWWYRQDEAARNAFVDPVDLKDALQAFSDWLRSLGVDPKDEFSCRMWSHGGSFDPPIIEAAYHAVELPVPWHYRAPRDTRTCFDDADVANHSEWLKQFNTGTLHHALDDAITQALGISYAKQRIDRWKLVYDATVDTITGVNNATSPSHEETGTVV